MNSGMTPGIGGSAPLLHSSSSQVQFLASSAIEKSELDSKSKRYVNAVERALSLFDSVEEWADHISFLGKLSKALKSHTGHWIPSDSLVAAKLASCLHPNLPSGVHQKTLEVYEYVFEILGSDNLAHTVTIWLPGLLPLMNFASINVKPPLVTLFRRHILPLPNYALRISLKSILVSLLPGIDDESSESFAAIMDLISDFRRNIEDDSFFWQAFYLVVVTTPDRRLGALAFANKNLPKFPFNPSEPSDSREDILAALPEECRAAVRPEPGLLLRMFSVGLTDSQQLVQRGFFDLMIDRLPLGCSVLQSLSRLEDLELLLNSASDVILRKDMSLNRRLWIWLLGPSNDQMTSSDSNSTLSRSQYFRSYGYTSLRSALRTQIYSQSAKQMNRAFQICLNMMDRWEIGTVIIPAVFLPMVETVYRIEDGRSVCKLQKPALRTSSEVFKGASALFDGIEALTIWADGFRLITNFRSLDLRFKPATTNIIDHVRYNMSLVLFMVENFNLADEEMLVTHLPLLLYTLLLLGQMIIIPHLTKESPEVHELWLKLCRTILDLIPSRALIPVHNAIPDSIPSDVEVIIRQIGKFYNASKDADTLIHEFEHLHSQQEKTAETIDGNTRVSSPGVSETDPNQLSEAADSNQMDPANDNVISPISGATLSYLLITNLSEITLGAITNLRDSSLDTCPSSFPYIWQLCDMLVSLHEKLPEHQNWRPQAIIDAVLQTPTAISPTAGFAIVKIILAVMDGLKRTEHRQLLYKAVDLIWTPLADSTGKYQVEAVTELWRLQEKANGREVEAALARSFLSSKTTSEERFSSFSALWTHSIERKDYDLILARPLFLFLDALRGSADPADRVYVEEWLHSTVLTGSSNRLFALLTYPLHSTRFLSRDPLVLRADTDDLDLFAYHVDTLRHVLQVGEYSEQLQKCLRTELAVIDNVVRQSLSVSHLELSSISTYQDLVLSVLKRVFAAELPSSEFDGLILEDVHQDRFLAAYRNAMRVSVELFQTIVDSSEAQLAPCLELLLNVVQRQLSLLNFKADPESPQYRYYSALADTNTFVHVLFVKAICRLLPLAHSGGISQSSVVKALRKDTGSENGSGVLEPLLVSVFQTESSSVFEAWVSVLIELTRTYPDIVESSLTVLVEGFCKQIGRTFEVICGPSTLSSLNRGQMPRNNQSGLSPEHSINHLLMGLENILEAAHGKLLEAEKSQTAMKGTSEPSSAGFFGSVMQGVFAVESSNGESPEISSFAFLIFLCFRTAIRTCFSIWIWAEEKQYIRTSGSRPSSVAIMGQQDEGPFAQSTVHHAAKLKFRTKKLVEKLFLLEPRETIETLIEFSVESPSMTKPVFKMLKVLDGSRPQLTVPHLFEGIMCRIDSNQVERPCRSSRSSELSSTQMGHFLIGYIQNLENDAIEDIWNQSVTFLKETVSKGSGFRQLLPELIGVVSELALKVDRTKFGAQRKPRKDLADAFFRVLASGIGPAKVNLASMQGSDQERGFVEGADQNLPEEAALKSSTTTLQNLAESQQSPTLASTKSASQENLCRALVAAAPSFPVIIQDVDRLSAAIGLVFANLISPINKLKDFPVAIPPYVVPLIAAIGDVIFSVNGIAANFTKQWKTLVGDVISDNRFFELSYPVIVSWKPAMIRWSSLDPEKLMECLGRAVGHTSNTNTLFGWNDQDMVQRKLSLRRVAFLLLINDEDHYIGQYNELIEQLETVARTTHSALTEVFLCLRAVVLRYSEQQLLTAWTTIYTLLVDILSRVEVKSEFEPVFSACKLLDMLLTLRIPNFQMMEWLFITDTSDAIYRETQFVGSGLADQLSHVLKVSKEIDDDNEITMIVIPKDKEPGKPLLAGQRIYDRTGMSIFSVKPFFDSLSMVNFDRVFNLEKGDIHACEKDLLDDIFSWS